MIKILTKRLAGSLLPVMLACLFCMMGTAAFTQTNIALGKTATASSVQDAGFPAGNAIDGNTTTRWSSQYADPQWIQVDLGATYSINRVVLRWEAAYGTAYQIQVSSNGTSWANIYTTTTGNGATDDLTGLSGTGRYIRMNGTARATIYGYSLFEFEVYGSPVTNIALSKPATASSVESTLTASNANDGNATTTRWGSLYADPQWIQIDLQATYNISRVVLRWEAAYATAYQIQVSSNGTSWSNIFSTTTGNGATDDLTGLSGTGRYIRMNGTARATQWGYSLFEFEVYGTQQGGGGDTQAPSVPGNLQSSGISQTGFTLTWNASTDNVGVTGYEVFRNGTSIGTPSGTSINVSGLTCNTSHAMTVRARDAAGNWSAQSSALNVTTSSCNAFDLSGYTLYKNYNFGTAAGNNVTNITQLAVDFNPYAIAGTTVINNEWQRYQTFNTTNHAFTTNDLALTAVANLGGIFNGGISSGQIASKETFYPRNGRTWVLQVRAKVPNKTAAWPAFWMYAKQAPNTPSEIDIFEFFDTPTQNSFDWTGYDHGTGVGSNYHNIMTNQWVWHPGFDFAADYHVYTLVWKEGDIQKWVDGTWVKGTNFTWNGSDPQAIINLAIGGSNNNNPVSSTFPCQYLVDYFKVYYKDGTALNGATTRSTEKPLGEIAREANGNELVYPNPASSRVSIPGLGNFVSGQIVVYDVMGKAVLSKRVANSIETLDVSSLPGGNYIIRIRHREAVLNKKLVIKK